MPDAIEVEALTKVYVKKRSLRQILRRPFGTAERVTALDGVDLRVQAGEIFGLLGPNGAGKTTLLKILTGLVVPTRGGARVAGHDVLTAGVGARSGIGFVTSEERSFYWRLSGRENLHFFGRLSNLSGPRLRRRCQELMDQVEVSAFADRPFMDYSSGMKQRLAVARALLHDPRVLVMDEPTRSLDPSAARHLRDMVRDVLNRQQGKTVLLATHNLDEAESLCHRIAILSRARVRRLGTVAEIRALESPKERYRVEVLPSFTPKADGYRVLESTPTRGGSAITLEFDRGGEGLTRFLGDALAASSRIAVCERLELPLQEVFDRAVAMEDEPPRPGSGR
jgi:ABC-2 type transport system ATP-binding protein